VDFKGLIDFNKYTLALGAASFVYALEKAVPATRGLAWYVSLAALALLFVSVVVGVIIFAAATAALHVDDTAKEDVARKERITGYMPPLGTAHVLLLATGLLLLGGVLFERVISPTPPLPPPQCCALVQPEK
jgi:uncharacterized membrane protein YjgN (DUF898 family)